MKEPIIPRNNHAWLAARFIPHTRALNADTISRCKIGAVPGSPRPSVSLKNTSLRASKRAMAHR